MSHRKIVSRTKLTVIEILAFLLATGFFCLAFADDWSSIVDKETTWTGFVEPQKIPVTLALSDKWAELDYDDEDDLCRCCTATAQLRETEGSKRIYYFRRKHGGSFQGWCERLLGKRMELTLLQKDKLEMQIKAIDETCILTRE